MIKVYVESSSSAELVAVFEDEDVYALCLPALEAMAKKDGSTLTESAVNNEELKGWGKSRRKRLLNFHDNRAIRIAKDVINGSTYKEAGDKVNLSAKRVNDIVTNLFRKTNNPRLGLPEDEAYTTRDRKKNPEAALKRIDALASYWAST